MDDHPRNLEEEDLLGAIICEGPLLGPLLVGDVVREGGDVLSFLNDTDGLEEEGEAGSGDRTMEMEGPYDGSGERMEEGDDGSVERTEEGVVAKSGEVYILIDALIVLVCTHLTLFFLLF